MRLGFNGRERIRKLSRPLSDEMDDWQTTITTWGDAQHDDDGGHTNISAESITTTGDATVGGALAVGGDAVITGALTAASITTTAPVAPVERTVFGTPVTPPALTGAAANYNPTGLSNVSTTWLRIASSGANNISGINRSTFPDGTYLIVSNVDAVDTITLVHEGTASTAANRMLGGGNVDIVLQPHDTVILISDAASNRWRALQF